MKSIRLKLQKIMIIPIVILILIILSENKVRANINVFSPYELRAGINNCNLWEDVTRGNLEIKNKGDFSNALLANPEMKNNIQKVKIDNFITEIPSNAFNSCKKLKEVSLPYSVAVIGAGAFSNTALESIILPKNLKTIGNYAFSGTEIKVINIPENVTSIGNYAFSKTNLTEIYIPESVTSIGDYAFSGGKLKKVLFIGQNVEKIGKDVFPKDVKIYGLSGTKICEYAKKNNLEFVDISADIGFKYNTNKLINDVNKEKDLFTAMALSDFVYHIEHSHILNIKKDFNIPVLGGILSSVTDVKNVVNVGPYSILYNPGYGSLTEGKKVNDILYSWTNGNNINMLAFNDDGDICKVANVGVPLNTYGFYKNIIGEFKYLYSEYDVETGFCGAAFLNNNQVWIVYCGTDPVNLREVVNDICMADALEIASVTKTPGQCTKALEFYKKIKEKYGTKSIRITGHSLGGALATYVSANTHEEAITINGANCLVVSNILFGARNNILDCIRNKKSFGDCLIPLNTMPYDWNVTNYMTDASDNNIVQKFMLGKVSIVSIGLMDGINAYVYPFNEMAKDSHNIFSFLKIEETENNIVQCQIPIFASKYYPSEKAKKRTLNDGICSNIFYSQRGKDKFDIKLYARAIFNNKYASDFIDICGIFWGIKGKVVSSALSYFATDYKDKIVNLPTEEKAEYTHGKEDIDIYDNTFILWSSKTKELTLTCQDSDKKVIVILTDYMNSTTVKREDKAYTTCLTIDKYKLDALKWQVSKIYIYNMNGKLLFGPSLSK